VTDILAALAAPFPPETISWRVGSTTKDKTRGLAFAYIDARDVQDRLDQVCGIFWQCRHSDAGGGKLACDIGIKVGMTDEWIWRGDGAGATDVEADKGTFSDAFKRAGVRWGIARYLYDIKSEWVAIERKGNSYVIALSELPKLRRLLGGHPMRDPRPVPLSDYPEAKCEAQDTGMKPAPRVKEIEMPGGALYEPGSETEAEVADAKLVADAWVAAQQGIWKLKHFVETLTREERASIKRLVIDELQPFARSVDQKESTETRELQARLRGQLEEPSP
jgi:hypothetical protein